MTSLKELTITEEESGLRLNRWFQRHFPNLTLSRLYKLLRTGQVRVDGKRVEAGFRLNAQQRVRIPPECYHKPETVAPKTRIRESTIKDIKARILYKDEDIIILNKPAGMAVQGGSNVHEHIDAMLDDLQFEAKEKPRLVHRLDKDTSGVLVIARNAKTTRKLGEAFQHGGVRKYYWAITVGVPELAKGKIDLALIRKGKAGNEKMVPDEEEGKYAITMYSVVEQAGKKAAWVAMWPRTGRTHQLRVHMTAIGTPLLGDGKYGGKNAFLEGVKLPEQLHLHARRIIFQHPRTNKIIDVSAPLPQHMKETWKYFGFDASDDGDPFKELE